MNQPRIGIIISSTRPSRIGDKVARWVQASTPEGATSEIIDLAEVNLPFFADLDTPRNGNYDTSETKAWAQTMDGFDGFIVALAEYNAGYPAPFKNALDSLYAEWSGKPFGIVSYGWYGGKRAVAALEPALANVGSVHLDSVNLTFNQDLAVDGTLLDAPEAALAKLWDDVTAAASTK